MNWNDTAIILKYRALGENNLLVTVLCEHQGRMSGLLRHGNNKKQIGQIQPGNLVQVEWTGRLEDQLGYFQIEPLQTYGAHALSNRATLRALNTLTAMADSCLIEKYPVTALYHVSLVLLEHLDNHDLWPRLYLKWELGLLNELGFELDLTKCAASGQSDDLIYISPRTGRAISMIAGEPFKNKLLPLPKSLLVEGENTEKSDLIAAFDVTEYFIVKEVFSGNQKKLPAARTRFIDRLR